eukprot:4998301-Alexandrium_andersonii.AAC.1
MRLCCLCSVGQSKRPGMCGSEREAASEAQAIASPGAASHHPVANSRPARAPTACGGCTATRVQRAECNQVASNQNANSTYCP